MIKLTENLAITADKNQYIVFTPGQRRAKDGNMRTAWKDPQYYSKLSTTLKQAIARAVREKTASEEITTLRELVAEQQCIQDDFAKLLEPLEA